MEKIKQFIDSEKGKDVLTVIIVVLVGLGSFELGRLSKGNSSSGIKILPTQAGEYQDQNSEEEANVISAVNSNKKVPPATNSTGKTYFASSKGSKYYSIGCSAGKSLKQENRIYFSTREEAEAAGYELSSSCK